MERSESTRNFWVFWSIWGLIAVGAAARADEPVIGVKEANALLSPAEKRPGSTSFGFTNAGGLTKPASLALKGPGFEVLSHVRGRATHFGTDALVRLISDATAHVAGRFKGSRLSVGNLGFSSGKKIPWSVSHQAGRDADLGMYALDEAGRPLGALPFVRFDAAGEATWHGQRVRFDVARNLALVTFLAEDPARRIQYIFVARWLKDLLLRSASREGVSATVRARLAEVLHQPSDSSPHADHFHIRVFCQIADRTFGCRDRGPRRDWIEMGDEIVDAYVGELGRVLRLPKHEKLVLGAVSRLEAIGVPSASPHLLGALSRPEPKVRKGALSALAATRDPAAALALVESLATIDDPAWLGEVLATAAGLADEAILGPAFALEAAPEKALHPSVKKNRKNAGVARSHIEIFVLNVLGSHGFSVRGRAVKVALGYASSKDKATKTAADAALRLLTCRFPRDRRWDRALDGGTAVGDGRAEDIAVGLRQVSPKLDARVKSRGHVDDLVRLLGHRDAAVRACANRALVDLTGHDADAGSRPPARHKRHWESWWKDNRGSSPLAR